MHFDLLQTTSYHIGLANYRRYPARTTFSCFIAFSTSLWTPASSLRIARRREEQWRTVTKGTQSDYPNQRYSGWTERCKTLSTPHTSWYANTYHKDHYSTCLDQPMTTSRQESSVFVRLLARSSINLTFTELILLLISTSAVFGPRFNQNLRFFLVSRLLMTTGYIKRMVASIRMSFVN